VTKEHWGLKPRTLEINVARTASIVQQLSNEAKKYSSSKCYNVVH